MNSIEEHQRVVSVLPVPEIIRAADTIANSGKLLICGNGGSSSDAQHMAAELVGRFKKERAPRPAIALVDSSILTAVGNDYGFDQVFARQVHALGDIGDCLLAISTSGNSENVIMAAKVAQVLGLTVIALTGKGGKLADLADIAIRVDSTDTARIQEAHILILHLICEALE
jgi:D-sedoheptulose 7-phosphate isomerase